LIECVREHAARKLPHLLHEGEPTPAGCVVLFALELAGAGGALGSFDLPEHGIESRGGSGR
jgi:hypothetical protein